MFNSPDKNFFSLKLIQSCPLCGRDYQDNRLQIIDEAENELLAYLSCQTCQGRVLARVTILPQGLVGNAILTDLESDEVSRFSKEGLVDANFVLEMHQQIKDQPEFIKNLK